MPSTAKTANSAREFRLSVKTAIQCRAGLLSTEDSTLSTYVIRDVHACKRLSVLVSVFERGVREVLLEMCKSLA